MERRSIIRLGTLLGTGLGTWTLRPGTAFLGLAFPAAHAQTASSRNLVDAMLSGPHRDRALPAYIAFAETIDRLEKFPTREEALRWQRSRAQELARGGLETLRAGLTRALNSTVNPLLVVRDQAGSQDVALPFLAVGTVPRIGDISPSESARDALRAMRESVEADPLSPSLVFTYRFDATRLQKLTSSGSSALPLPLPIERALSSESRIRGQAVGLLGIAQQGVGRIIELGRKSIGASPEQQARFAQEANVIGNHVRALMGNVESAWGFVRQIGGGNPRIDKSSVGASLRGAADISGKLAAMLNINPEDAKLVTGGLNAAAAIVSGMLTPNPLAIVGTVTGLLEGMFGGGDAAQQQQQAIQKLGSMVADLQAEMRLQFDDMRQRLVDIESRLVSIQTAIASLTYQLEGVELTINARIDDINRLLRASFGVDLQLHWNALQQAADFLSRSHSDLLLGIALRDPVFASEVAIGRTNIRREGTELLSRFAPGDTGLGHPALCGSLRLDPTLSIWAQRGVQGKELTRFAQVVSSALCDPYYGGRGATEGDPSSASFVLDTIDEFYRFLPAQSVTQGNAEALALLPGTIVGNRFEPYRSGARAVPQDVFTTSNRLMIAFDRVRDPELARPLRQDLLLALRDHLRGLQLLNAPDSFEYLLDAFSRGTAEFFAEVHELFDNPVMTALRNLAKGTAVRRLADTPGELYERYSGVLFPLSKSFKMPPLWSTGLAVPGDVFSRQADAGRKAGAERYDSDQNAIQKELSTVFASGPPNTSETTFLVASGREFQAFPPPDAEFVKLIESASAELTSHLAKARTTFLAWSARVAGATLTRGADGKPAAIFDGNELKADTSFREWYESAVSIVNSRLPKADAELDRYLRRVGERPGLGLAERCARLLRATFALRVFAELIDLRRREFIKATGKGKAESTFLLLFDRIATPIAEAALRGLRQQPEREAFVECVLPRLQVEIVKQGDVPKTELIGFVAGPGLLLGLIQGGYAINAPSFVQEVSVMVTSLRVRRISNDQAGAPSAQTAIGRVSERVPRTWKADLDAWTKEAARSTSLPEAWLATCNPAAQAVARTYAELHARVEADRLMAQVVPKFANSLNDAKFQEIVERAVGNLYSV